MDLYDFFFPEQAQASHLRKIANQRPITSQPAGPTEQSSEMRALRDDVQFLALVITALLKRLSETETLSIGDVQDLLDEIDTLDGVADGGLDPGMLRGMLGVVKHENDGETAAVENEEVRIVATPRYRRR